MTTSKYGTTFVESEAILASQADDAVEVERLLGSMLPGERRELSSACYRLLDAITEADREWRAQVRVDRKIGA